MDFSSQNIPYQRTGFFSKMAIDYVNAAEGLKPFYSYPVSIEGIKASIA